MLQVKIRPKKGETPSEVSIQDRLKVLTRNLLPLEAAVVTRLKNGVNGYFLDHDGNTTVRVKTGKNLSAEIKQVIEEADFLIIVH